MQSVIEWVHRARTAAGLTQEELGERLNVTKSTVSHWENGRSPPSISQLLEIEKITGVPWRGNEGSELKPVAVVGTAKLGDQGYYEEISTVPGVGDGYLDFFSKDKHAYALRLRGSSMFPAIRDGWYAVMEPSFPVVEGEYVLVKLKDGRRMVKELLFRRSGSIELMSVNGQERIVLDYADLDEYNPVQPVAAIVPPSRYKPD